MSAKPCKDCGAENRVLNGGRCRLCSGANQVYRKFATGGPEARHLISKMIRKGHLRPASEFACADCGKQAMVWEHRDYNKPLDVVPVCKPCNARRGEAIPKAMTFQELMTKVRAYKNFENLNPAMFEQLRRKYWPNEQQGENK